MPSFMLTNVNHIMNKLDEIYLLVRNFNPGILAITETWLDSNIPDSAINIDGYTVFRKDRSSMTGGGVLFYVDKNLYCKPLVIDCCHPVTSDNVTVELEILWIYIRPKVLPRPFGQLIFCVLYCPPWYDAATKTHLSFTVLNTVNYLSAKYPNAGFFISGDFNLLDCGVFNKHLCFKQLVRQPTRGSHTLDKIFTNCQQFYNESVILPPVGKSDHNCILLPCTIVDRRPSGYRTVLTRRLNPNIMNSIGLDLYRVRWQDLFRLESVQSQADFFYEVVEGTINKWAPLIPRKFKNNDKPWINNYFKELINDRNNAFNSNDHTRYKILRNRVNRVSKSLKSQFYLDSVDDLKKSDVRCWWKQIKLLSGLYCNQLSAFSNIAYNHDISVSRLPDVFNKHLISVTENIPPIDLESISTLIADQSVSIPDSCIVSERAVYDAMRRLGVRKATCELVIGNRFIVEFADILSAPICSIINASFRQCSIPSQWKHSKIVPIPKVNPPVSIESDLRPIAITSPLAKIAESFMNQSFNNHFKKYADKNQFGCTAHRSTTLALLKFAEELYRSADDSSNIIRIMFVDLSKAFDRVNHNILLHKFVDNNFPNSITMWSVMFLHNRTQYVSMDGHSSSTVISHAGTPQGTLAGPNNFKLLINDLKLGITYIKYVDDLSCLSVSTNPNDSTLQSAANDVFSWSDDNDMLLNTTKTKEMIVYFGKRFSDTDIPALIINDQQIERVNVFKLLGVVFCSNLNWQHHIDYILKKAAKRYFVIYQLNRARVKPDDIIIVYCSLIRSILEYACPVWHSGLTVAQSNDLENVQKRCLHIIYPELSYSDALVVTGLERLDKRREAIVRKTFCTIKQPDNALHDVLDRYLRPPSTRVLRLTPYEYRVPAAKTNRYLHSFFPYCINNRF